MYVYAYTHASIEMMTKEKTNYMNAKEETRVITMTLAATTIPVVAVLGWKERAPADLIEVGLQVR